MNCNQKMLNFTEKTSDTTNKEIYDLEIKVKEIQKKT